MTPPPRIAVRSLVRLGAVFLSLPIAFPSTNARAQGKSPQAEIAADTRYAQIDLSDDGYLVGLAPQPGEFFRAAAPGSYADERGILSPARLERGYTTDPTSRHLVEVEYESEPDVVVSPRSPRGGLPPRAKRGMAVRLGERLLFSEGGRFAFRLPWERDRYVITPTRREMRGPRDYTFHGTVGVAGGNEVGHLLVMRKGERYFGSLALDGRSFRLEPLGRGGVVALVEEGDPPASSRNCDGAGGHDRGGEQAAPRESPAADLSVTARSSSSREVRVLVMYTDRAEAIWDPEVSAERSMEETNQALLNSGITTSQLRFRLVGVERLAGFAETDDIATDINEFTDDPFVAQRRAAREADLVVLLTDGNYEIGTLGARVLGRATTREPGDADRAHAIVEVDAPGSRQTFTHELGHLFGGQHQDQEALWPDDLSDVARYAFPHRWKHDIFSLRRSSIMWTSVGIRGNELRFSNPDLWSASERTGVEGTRDMAQQLRDQAATVARYVNVPRLSASISGPSSLRPNARGTFRANISDCGGSATYRWEQADDGRSYRFIGSSSSVSIRAGNVHSTTLRLRVTCGGQTVTAFRYVFVGGGSGGGCGSEIICLTGGEGLPEVQPADAALERTNLSARGAAVAPDDLGSIGLHLFPNPSDGYKLGIAFTGVLSSTAEVAFRDLLTGRVVHAAQLPPGTAGAIELDLPALPPGAYSVTYSGDGYSETQRLTIAR